MVAIRKARPNIAILQHHTAYAYNREHISATCNVLTVHDSNCISAFSDHYISTSCIEALHKQLHKQRSTECRVM